MSHIIMEWAFSCSDCGKIICCKIAESLPRECPYCKCEFERPNAEIKAEEVTFLPAVDKVLNKISQLKQTSDQ